MARSMKERTPIKAEMGSWNFVKSEMRNKSIHWFCVCDCERSVRWILPCLLKPDSLCFSCATEKKMKAYRAGKQALSVHPTVVEEEKPIVEKVAPEGQLSLDALPKEEPIPQIPFDASEKQWLGQIEFFLETITDIVGKLKEAQSKRGV